MAHDPFVSLGEREIALTQGKGVCVTFKVFQQAREAIQSGKKAGIIRLRILFRQNEGMAEFGFRLREAFGLMKKNPE